MAKDPAFEGVHILLDYNRGTRGGSNSCSMLQPLLADFPDKVRVCLYQNPRLRGVVQRFLPARWNEIFGVQHIKLYIFDDTVVISGANLSDLYFEQRQDRYMVITDKALASFCADLVDAVSAGSFKLIHHGPESNERRLEVDPRCPVHPCTGDLVTYIKFMRNGIQRVALSWCLKMSLLDCSRDTQITPLLQLGPFDIDMDERVMQHVFSTQDASCDLHLASGYFNLTSRYESCLVNRCAARVRVLAAGPQANGFWQGEGISGLIPNLYTHFARRFYDAIQRAGTGTRLRLFEFVRPGWSFHAKGVWLSGRRYHSGGDQRSKSGLTETSTEELEQPNQSSSALLSACSPILLPHTTFIGSTNYGYRSIHRDLEVQFMIQTDDELLRTRLARERDQLFMYSYPVDGTVFKRKDHHVPFWLGFLSRMIRRFF
jgi:CDP-diacylglycerol--glycerol-3-phosphate 3-phosphatidyltransferase